MVLCEMDPLHRVSRRAKRLMARQLRRDATPMERHAWSLLRRRNILGLKFRRQHVLDGFIVDFYCAELKLIIELDGAHHANPMQAAYDDARTKWLEARGRHVLRLKNVDLSADALARLLEPWKRRPST